MGGQGGAGGVGRAWGKQEWGGASKPGQVGQDGGGGGTGLGLSGRDLARRGRTACKGGGGAGRRNSAERGGVRRAGSLRRGRAFSSRSRFRVKQHTAAGPATALASAPVGGCIG